MLFYYILRFYFNNIFVLISVFIYIRLHTIFLVFLLKIIKHYAHLHLQFDDAEHIIFIIYNLEYNNIQKPSGMKWVILFIFIFIPIRIMRSTVDHLQKYHKFYYHLSRVNIDIQIQKIMMEF